jgi:hypothetical protein
MVDKKLLKLDDLVAVEYCPYCYNYVIYSDNSQIFLPITPDKIPQEIKELYKRQDGTVWDKDQEVDSCIVKAESPLGPMGAQLCLRNSLYFGFDAEALLAAQKREPLIVEYLVWSSLPESDDKLEELKGLGEVLGAYRYDTKRPRLVFVDEVDLKQAKSIVYETVLKELVDVMKQRLVIEKTTPKYEDVKKVLRERQKNKHKTCSCNK